MKKTVSIFVMLTLISSIVFAGGIVEDPKNPTKNGSTVIKCGAIFKLFYKAESTEDVRVTIYNSDNEPVFKETLRQTEGFMRPYNLNKLEEGEYRLDIADKNGVESKSLHHFAEKSKSLITVIQLLETPEKFLLTIGKKESAEMIGVRIFNERNEVIYEQSERVQGDFSKVYNIKKGNHFRFEITDSNGTRVIDKSKNPLIASVK